MKTSFDNNYKNYHALSNVVSRCNACPMLPHSKYTKSKQWEVRRQAYLTYTGNTCQICGNYIPSNAALHHMTYTGSYGQQIVCREQVNDVLICHSSCHSNYHLSESLHKPIDTGSFAMYPIKPYAPKDDEW